MCITGLTYKDLTGGTPSTIWATNGIANSSCNLLCTLIMSWLEGSHRAFQTLTYFSLLMLLRGQRRSALPLFYRWENWDLRSLCVLPGSPWKLACYPVCCSPAPDAPAAHTGKSVQGVFHPDLELPLNFICFTFLYISSDAWNKQNKSILHPGFFRIVQLKGQWFEVCLSVECMIASKYYLSL